MSAQVHAGPSSLYAFPTSSSFPSPTSNPEGVQTKVLAKPSNHKGKAAVNSQANPSTHTKPSTTSLASSSTNLIEQPVEPPLPPRSSLDSSDANVQRQKRSARQNQSSHTARPRLKSLHSLNAAPASPSLSESTSANAQLLSASSSRLHHAGSSVAIESLQPLAAAAAASAAASGSSIQQPNSFQNPSHRPLSKENLPQRGSYHSSTAPSSSPKKTLAMPSSSRAETEFSEFGFLTSAKSATRRSGEIEATRNFHNNNNNNNNTTTTTTASLRRSNTVMVAGDIYHHAPEANTASGSKRTSGSLYGFSHASAHLGRGRDGPSLGARRQTVSNIGGSGFDHHLTGQGRTIAYAQQQQQQQYHHPHFSSGLLAPSSQSHIRDRSGLQSNQLEAKVVILGTQGVGKTSLVHRYTSGQFSASSIPSTIGASFFTKKLIVDGVKVRLQLWDTAGQERFRSMAPMYYRGSNAAVIAYDITSMSSFLDIRSWIEELRKNMSTDLVIHIVGAKLDLAPSSRAVDLDYARATIRFWTRPTPTPPESPKPLPTPSPHRATSRLSGFGNLAMGSASRLASFQRGHSPTSAERNAPMGSAGSGNSTGSAASDPGKDLFSDPDSISAAASTWDQIEVSEVSAKDDEGIEDVFLAITKKLVERKALIEQDRLSRERDSIVLSDSGWEQGSNNADGAAASHGQANWSCC